jgi:hypothetical protein
MARRNALTPSSVRPIVFIRWPLAAHSRGSPGKRFRRLS